jgi:hypothetical protein
MFVLWWVVMLWNGLWILRMPFWLSSSAGVKEINLWSRLPGFPSLSLFLSFPVSPDYLAVSLWEVLFGVENGTDILFRLRCLGMGHVMEFVRYVSSARNNLLPPSAGWKHFCPPYYTASQMRKL